MFSDPRWGMNNSAALDYGAYWRDNSNPYMYAGSSRPSYGSYLNMNAAVQQELERLDLDALRNGAVDNRGGVTLPVAGRSNAAVANALNAQLHGMNAIDFQDWNGGVENYQRNGGFGTHDYLNSRVLGYAHLPTLQGPLGQVNPQEANFYSEMMRPYDQRLEASFPQNAGAAPMTQAWIQGDNNPAPAGTREGSFTMNGQTPIISNTPGGGIATYGQNSDGGWFSNRLTSNSNQSQYGQAKGGMTGGMQLGGPGGYIAMGGTNPGATGYRPYNSFGPDAQTQNGTNRTYSNGSVMRYEGGGNYESRSANYPETSRDIYENFYQPFGTFNRPGSVYGQSNEGWDKGMGFIMPGQNLPWQLPPAYPVSSYSPNSAQTPGQQMYGGIAGGMLGSYGGGMQYPSGYSGTGYGGVFNQDFGTRRY